MTATTESTSRCARRAQVALTMAIAVAGAFASADISAQPLDTRVIASGLTEPLFATAPLSDGRVFIVEKGGTIKLAQNGATSTFFSLPVATGGEQGLLGLAFDPNYGVVGSAGYGRFFVDYIDPTSLDTVVASYRSSGTGVVANSRVEVLRIDQPDGRTNHKGGWIGFQPGNANNLYIATGDGGSANDPDNNGQNRDSLLGKVLRVDINADAFADPNINYGIPSNNPLIGVAGTRAEVFAYGLRNPFRNGFDPTTGNLYIGDVGQGAREEVDFISAASAGGQNFGWRLREGTIATPGVGGDAPGATNPVLEYASAGGAAITGGYVVRDPASPLNGMYVFGDFVRGTIWAVALDANGLPTGSPMDITAALDAGAGGALGNISSFGQGASGEFFIVDYAGKVVQVVPEPGTALMMLAGVALLCAYRRRTR